MEASGTEPRKKTSLPSVKALAWIVSLSFVAAGPAWMRTPLKSVPKACSIFCFGRGRQRRAAAARRLDGVFGLLVDGPALGADGTRVLAADQPGELRPGGPLRRVDDRRRAAGVERGHDLTGDQVGFLLVRVAGRAHQQLRLDAG